MSLEKKRQEILAYGLSFPDTFQDAPFHDDNWQLVRYKGNNKAFLWTYEKDGFMNLNLKVDPIKHFSGESYISLWFPDTIRINCIGIR